MPRGSRSTRQAQPPPQSPPVSPAPAPRPQTKKRTVADNARAIDSITSKLDTMSSLLSQVVGSIHPQPETRAPAADPGHPEPVEDGLPTPLRSRHRSDFPYNDFYTQPRARHNSVNSLTATGFGPDARRDVSRRRAPYTRAHVADPLGARSTRPPRREMPTTLHDLDDTTELQDRVAHLISSTLAPSHITGKKAFAHSFIRRGEKKARTTLGDLSPAEYNLGFMRLMNSTEVDPADRPLMLQHLEYVNEDTIMYPFSDVRAWSEEICFLIAEGELGWDDHYRIDLLRLKLSQNGPAGRDQKDSKTQREGRRTFDGGALDPASEFSPEIRAARPGPPCRLFNSTGCSHKTHHVANGFRYLHVCSSCVYHKCLLIPHPERDCKSKEYRKKNVAREADPGFGK